MSMKMKCLLLSLFALVAIGGFTTRANYTNDNVVKKEIVVKQDKSDYDRSDSYSVKVYYLPLSSEIEVNCLDQGGVAVYLFNSRNQMCGYAEFDSSEMSFERIDVPKESGTYYIAIITDKSYSEGSFTK